jgi:hypothetical protein
VRTEEYALDLLLIFSMGICCRPPISYLLCAKDYIHIVLVQSLVHARPFVISLTINFLFTFYIRLFLYRRRVLANEHSMLAHHHLIASSALSTLVHPSSPDRSSSPSRFIAPCWEVCAA